jgi:hypothetical protein
MLLLKAPLALAPNPVAVLALAAPLALALNPIAVLTLKSPLASAERPVAVLTLAAPLAFAAKPVAVLLLPLPLALAVLPQAKLPRLPAAVAPWPVRPGVSAQTNCACACGAPTQPRAQCPARWRPIAGLALKVSGNS